MHLISADKLKQKWHKVINVLVALVLAVMLFPLFPPATPVVYAHPAVPVVENYVTTTTGGTAANSFTFASAPTGLSAGDLILLICMSEQANTDDWNAVSGYTRIALGNNPSDAHLTFYWRIATGDANDGFPNLTVTRGSNDYAVGWAVRISGVDTSAPINATGTAQIGTGTALTVNEVTTDVADCLAIYGIALDGSDISPSSVTGGTGWSLEASLEDPTNNAQGVGGDWGTKEVAGAGGTGTVSLDFSGTGSDGYQAVQIAIAPLLATDVTVDTIGTQTATMTVPSTDNYVGGAFTIVDNTGSRNVTGITITENGTVDAQNNLANVELWYDIDNTAPYDGASVSYSGDETQFGSATSFNGADGTASFSGTVGISTTATMVVYVVLDVGSGAGSGQTLEIKINDPSTEVTVSTGTVGPASAVAIAGITTLSGPNTEQLHFRWRDDTTDLNTDGGWQAVEDSNSIGMLEQNTTIRLRIEAANTGDAAESAARTYELQWSQKSTTCADCITWTGIGDASDAFDMVGTTYIDPDGESATPGLLANSEAYTFVTGEGRDTADTAGSIGPLSASYYTELEFSFKATDSASAGTSYCFRLYDTTAASPLDNYAVYPEVTIYTLTIAPTLESFLTGVSNSTSVYIGKPEGTVDGDLLIAIMATDGGARTLTAPGGWTPITDNISDGTYQTSRSWYKIASSEPAAYTFTVSAGEHIIIGILRISDHNSSSPIDVSGTATGTSSTPTCPTVTTTVDNTLVLRYFGADDDDITSDRGYPSAHTGIYVRGSAAASTATSSSGTAYTTQESAGATGTAAFTLTASEQWSAVTIAIAPAAPTVIDVTADIIGTQEPVVSIPSTDQYVGGAFTIVDNTGSRNVTGITITEHGTVDAQNNLANVELWYDLDTTLPYDGASVSYSGDETQFGSATTFNGADGTASFSGTVGISTTATMVVYVVLDVGSGASDGRNLEIKINDPSTEVTVSTGTVEPDTAVAISGTTTLSVGVTQAHYLWRNDDGGEWTAWYNTDWGYRKKIAFTADITKIPSTQSNFPVLIDVTNTDLRTTGDGGHVQHTSGWDIVFTDSDGTTLLDHEIEKYTSSGSNATYTAWVRIPSLSMGKVIYMYYGKTGVASDPSATTTWDSNFKMVQHLDETTGTHEDSTVNTNDGTAQEGVTQDATGKINGGDEFDGIDNYIDCGTGASLDITTNITLEAWVKKATPVKRDIAEFEPKDGVLIRYPFGLPYTLIADMADDVEIVTVVASSGEATTVQGLYDSNGVGCENGCSYLIHPSDAYWTRDSALMMMWDENEQLRIVDFTYNRSRSNDNNRPQAYGSWRGIPVDWMALIHSGGNWMSDGRGKALTTTLITTENPNLTEAEIDAEALDHYGINTWDKRPNAGGASIAHIDCWSKLLAPDKIMIGDWNSALDDEATYFSTTATTPYGGNYTVYRIGVGPYVNSFILNDKVYMPFNGVAADATAQTAFENAMPGYTVRGYTGSWGNDDATHCRVHEIAQSTPWDFDFIVSKGQDAYELQMNRIGSTLNGYTSTNQITTSTSSPTDWHHYVLTFDGTSQKLYIDGELKNTETQGGIGSNSTEVTIGGSVPSGNFSSTLDDEGYFSGTLDEVRISATPRTADWIKTLYHNQNSPSTFHSVGSEEASAVGASRKAAEDTAVTGQARVENLRLRFLIKNTGGTATDYNYRLQVSETGPTSGFTDVPTNTAGPGCAVAATVTSTNFTNQDPTTRQLSVSHCDTWTAGKMVEDPSNQTDVITLNNLRFTEVEFNLKFTSNAAGETTYWFRVVNSATPLDNYSQVAQITITTVPAWDSYEENYGDSGGTLCDEFFDYATEHEVYMYGTGFSTGNYKVVYWDEAGSEVQVDSSIAVTGDGKLKSICVFDPPMATEGDWHVTVYYPSSYEPAAYSTVDSNIVADDTSYTTACGYAFYVDQGAIPEFPTVIAAISVAGLCFGIYYWMRKRRLAHVKA